MYLDIGIEYSVYGLIFFIPVSIARISIFACIAILLFVAKQALSPDLSVIKSNKIFFIILSAFFLFMALSLLNSGPLLDKSVKALFIKWGRFPLILWVILDTFRDPKRIVKAMYVLLFSAILIELSVLSEQFLHWEFLRGRAISGPIIIKGPFKNQNALAAYLTSVIPVVLCLGLWKWKRLTVKLALLLLTVMLLASSFWTLCRGGWAGLAAGLLLVFLLINYRYLQKKIFWFLFTASYLFIVPLFAFALFMFLKKGDNTRTFLLQGAWRMIQEHPFFGKGLGTFMDYCSLYASNQGASYLHNCFLQIWAESGIFALLSFILLLGYVFYKSIKVSFRMQPVLNFFLLVGLTSGFLGVVVHSFFEVHLYSFQLSFLFWTMLGLTIAAGSSFSQE